MIAADDRAAGLPRSADCDVLVLGGGLAGLTLALQLRGRHPDLSICVLERRRHPVPEAAFKVGESTVEIGAHYFADVLGLREHLETAHVRKFGFRFFFNDGEAALDRCVELGASRQLPVPAWQIDRGRFENFLGERCRALGIEFLDGAVVRSITLGGEDGEDGTGRHAVEYEHAGARSHATARWLVDASGRAALLKRKLDLAQSNAHDVNAVWFRIDGRIDPDAWSDDRAWLARCAPPERWRSTNHLCGEGYWVWLIPLASGSHSVGIVADGGLHPLESINSFDKSMAWLHRHQPQLAAALEPMRERLQDFAFLRHFSHGCRQLFSPARLAITGEAGLFLDPFYSPGSDFIAIANTYIAELVSKDLAGEPFAPYASVYEQLYVSFYESTLAMYLDQYPLFGDATLMSLKVVWDYTYYWGVLAPLFFGGRIAHLPTLSRLRDELAQAKALNVAMQRLLRDWGARRRAAGAELAPADGATPMLDQASVDWFAGMNRALLDPLDDTAFRQRIRANLHRLRALAADLLSQARDADAQVDAGELVALLGDLQPVRQLPLHWYGAQAAISA